jgi:hypothetical protein
LKEEKLKKLYFDFETLIVIWYYAEVLEITLVGYRSPRLKIIGISFYHWDVIPRLWEGEVNLKILFP